MFHLCEVAVAVLALFNATQLVLCFQASTKLGDIESEMIGTGWGCLECAVHVRRIAASLLQG